VAVDMFLKLDGIDGESTDKTHEKWIEIESFSWGVSNSGSLVVGGGGGAGRAVPSDFAVVMPFSSASPQLFKKAVLGQHIDTATIELRRAAGDQREAFLKYGFRTIAVKTISWTSSGDEGPEEEVTFEFGELDVQYHAQKPDGSLGDLVEASFDFIKNTA
jgi:type VI secretion system secreted protein Hcp